MYLPSESPSSCWGLLLGSWMLGRYQGNEFCAITDPIDENTEHKSSNIIHCIGW